MKYQKLGEQWGEPEVPKGAETTPQYTEPAPSRVPREQELSQSSILGYLEPAPLTPRIGGEGGSPTTGNQGPREQDRPTVGNLVPCPEVDPCTTRMSGGGSPCVEKNGFTLIQVSEDEPLDGGGGSGVIEEGVCTGDNQEVKYRTSTMNTDDQSMDEEYVLRAEDQSMDDECVV